jgi:iron complex outermembrane receptor protein
MSRLRVFGCAALGLCASAPPAFAQSAVQIPEIVIEGASADAAAVPVKEKYQLPQTTASVTAEKIEQTTNTVDTEDAVKYMPSLFVRKRNYATPSPCLRRARGASAPAPVAWFMPMTFC